MISIVLATYNERDSIVTTITRLLERAPEPMEIIVVDDDSPDNTWHVVESLGLPNVTVICRQGTHGLASAFNRSIIESRDEYEGWMPPPVNRLLFALATAEFPAAALASLRSGSTLLLELVRR
jgi:glycosyltransferase involved in cell wall biosynthesis